MSKIDRRQFIRMAGTAAAGTLIAPLGLLQARAMTAALECMPASFAAPGFGPIAPRLPENTAELGNVAGLGDLRGLPLLALPEGFRYNAVSIRGDRMSDGALVPGDHDGMACFRTRRGDYALVRNHELSIIEDEAGSVTGCLAPNGRRYDPFAGIAAGLGGGGTSTLIIDRFGRRVRDYVSLGGTIRNCAGGPTPWSSWISCEEDVTTPATNPLATKRHGYNFEVPADLGEAVDPVPLVAMGRMNHEAVSVDPFTGIVYQTEDRNDSCWYRFVPRRRPYRYGDLQEGGELHALVIDPGQRSACTGEPLPTSLLQGTAVVDTRGVARGAPASMLPFLGQPLRAHWVRIDDVDPAEDSLRHEAQAKGAAVFWRGEGAWHHNGKHYWVCSGAGDAGEGQVWCYDPWTETVTLLLESTDENLLDSPDNLTIAGDGTLYLCEDGSDDSPGDPNYGQYVVGVDGAGGLFHFAHNLLDTSEFAGACFAPGDRIMAVNSQGLGVTYTIWREDGRPIALHQRGRGHRF
jgi:uncharacterized protein